MRLTDTAIRKAKPSDKPYKMFDGEGLYLLVYPAGAKTWHLKYRIAGKEKKLTLGRYPDVSLNEAREALREQKKQISKGIDPAKPKPEENSFQTVAEQWLAKRAKLWSSKTHADCEARLKAYIYPQFGHKPITTIEAPDILDALQKIEARGTHELAHRVHQYIGQIYRFAIATRSAQRNPAADLRGALTPVTRKGMAHLTEAELPDFLKKMKAYPGDIVVRLAGIFLLHTFVRTGEMRFSKWEEIDWKAKLWRIPPERMKMRRPHVVPLSSQVLAMLRTLQQLNGDFEYIFATPLNPTQPISENAVLYMIYRLGYRGKTTGHGFRSLASTILHENGFHPDAIERQLAHLEGNAVKAAYNHAQYLPDRKKMMQWWSDYLDKVA